jgi:hypothetical protein
MVQFGLDYAAISEKITPLEMDYNDKIRMVVQLGMYCFNQSVIDLTIKNRLRLPSGIYCTIYNELPRQV